MSTLWENFVSLPAERKALSLFVIVAIIAMIAAWYDRSPKLPPKDFNPATPIVGTDVPKKEVTIKKGKVKVLPKGSVKKHTDGLPPEVDNEDTEFTATAEVPASDNGHQVVSTINTNTGETKLLVKENQAPLFAFENKRRVGVGYGMGTGGQTAKVFGEWSFLRVGNMHVGAQGEISSNQTKSPEAKGMAIVDYRW